MIVSILQNVIRKILRRRPCQNFLPGVLCVTQGHRITYRYVPQGHLWVESSIALTPALWPCTFCSDPSCDQVFLTVYHVESRYNFYLCFVQRKLKPFGSDMHQIV